MRLRSLPVASFLSASAVLAVPHTGRSSGQYGVAGVTISEDCQTFRTIGSSFSFPIVAGDPGSDVAFVNSISDGPIGFQVGILCGISAESFCDVFTQASPTSVNHHSSFDMVFGDTISLYIRMESATSAVAFILNQRTNQYVNDTLQSDQPLCMRDATWAIKTPLNENGGFGPLADFEQVIFTDAMATDWPGWARYTPTEGDSIYNIAQGGQDITTVWVQQDSVIIRYV